MPKCTRCGRKGFFLKLTNGLCANCTSTVRMEQEQAELQDKLDKLNAQLSDQQALFDKISAEARADGTAKARTENAELTTTKLQLEEWILQSKNHLDELAKKEEKSRKSAENAEQKVRRSKELIKAIQHASEVFGTEDELPSVDDLLKDADALMQPTVTLTLQCLDMKELRKRYRENEKSIQATFEKYKDRYTTKANITIYRLMVIALSAELQNVLNNISFGKLDDALNDIKTITNKYYVIAADGNQSIAPTVKKFIGELDYYFQEAVKIEYEYYVQKERAREEQRAIREQMRQEAVRRARAARVGAPAQTDREGRKQVSRPDQSADRADAVCG